MQMDTPRIVLNIWRLTQIWSFYLVNVAVKEPYMDEIFHVPQAQLYCEGEFQYYDPKLTTPPGLYFLSYALHTIGMPCSTLYLRYVNLFTGTILLPNLCSRIWHLRHRNATATQLRWAQCIAMMPILSFFSLLYYTDVLSTYCVLLVYYFTLQGKIVISSIVGILSLFFRQTNLVWVAAFAALGILSELDSVSSDRLIDPPSFRAGLHSTVVSLAGALQATIRYRKITLKFCAVYSPLAILSISFLLWNGSIVLGDKTMHQAGFYPIQLFYMASFSVAISCPLFLHRSTISSIYNTIWRPISLVGLLSVCALAATMKGIQHPFILSDNRHFTFYLNRRIIQRVSESVLGLIFTFFTSLFVSQISHLGIIELLIIAGAAGCILVPTSLLEARYYLVPYLLWRMELREDRLNSTTRLCETIFWIFLNNFSLYLFLCKGFHWDNTSGIQRFMW